MTASIKKYLTLVPIFILTASATLLNAQSENFSLGGYVKYLPSYVEYKNIDEHLWDQLLHFRLNSRWYASDHFTAALEIRFRAYQGESIEKVPFYKEIFYSSDYEFNQLSWYLWETGNSLGYLQIDRLWAEYVYDNFQITAGRQRVAWGTALVWNITDIFNPLNILDFDYEERPGSDVVRLQYFPSPLSTLDMVIKPASAGERTIGAARFTFNRWEYDFHALLGMKGKAFFAGFAFAGDIHGAGFRGEFTYMESRQSDINVLPVIPYTPSFIALMNPYKDANFAAVLSADYTFTNSLYLHTEAIYNSIGKTENLGLLQLLAAQAGLLSPSKMELFFEAAYDITPLMRGDVFFIYNPYDFSFIWAPSINYNLTENLDLMAIGLLAEGDNLTQYGNYGQSIYLRLKYSF